MQEKDKIEKILFDYNDIFADIINGLIYGKYVVEEDQLRPDSTTSVYKAEAGDYTSQIRDIAKYFNNHVKFAIFGLENQTKIDKHMVLRIMGYDGASYRNQYKSSSLAPVITLVLNFDTKPWPDEMKHLYGIIDIPDELKPFVPDYRINVFDICDLKEEIRNGFKSDFKVIADFFYQKKHADVYQPPEDKIIHVYEFLDFLGIFADDTRYVDIQKDILESQKKGDVTMCTIASSIEERGIEKGIERGIERGKEIGENRLSALINKLISEGLSDMIGTVTSDPKEREAYYKKYNL